VVVHDVKMDPIGTGSNDVLYLITQTGKVS
jgi:hypothetical protein